jgi:hypothetical protein
VQSSSSVIEKSVTRAAAEAGVEPEAVAQRRFQSSVPRLPLRLHRPALQVLLFSHPAPSPDFQPGADLASNGVNRLPFLRRQSELGGGDVFFQVRDR